MKTFLTTLILSAIILSALGQEEAPAEGWVKGGQLGLTFSQTSLTNWSTGGQNSLAFNGFFSLFGNYKKDKSSWDNSLDLAYALTKQGDMGFIKSDDKIDFSSKFGHALTKTLNVASLLNFKSQFSNGFAYPNDSVVISRFLAPGYISLGVGVDYKPRDYLSLYYSPATGRIIIVNDQEIANKGGFGVEPAEFDTVGNVIKQGEKIKFGFGSLLRIEFVKDIIENVNFKTKLEFFSDYLDKPENIDVYWDVLLTMKINKFLSANLNTTLIYDYNIMITDKNGKTGPRTQFKEVFGVGLTYSLNK